MENIRKKINLHDFSSKRPGIMPFIEKESDISDIQYVETVTSNSNYGNFPCDFGLVKVKEILDSDTGINYIEKTELDRFRYCDIINRYNFDSNRIKNGKILKRGNFQSINTSYVDCINEENSIVTTESFYRWTICDEDVSIFDLMPVDSSFFSVFNENGYVLNDSILTMFDNLSSLVSNGAELTEIQQKTYDKLNLFIGNDGLLFGDNGKHVIILEDYDTILDHENSWNEWWQKCYEMSLYYDENYSWEETILDERYSIPSYFKFVYDVEKYIIGRIRVPERNNNGYEITGIKTPMFLYYLNYNLYRQWFADNADNINNDSIIKKMWDELGGQAFYDYLNLISPKFLQRLGLPDTGEAIVFTYLPPNIEIPISIEGESETDKMLKPYELSIDSDGNVEDGTFMYIANNNGIGSALTPSFAVYENEVFAESKLDELISSASTSLDNGVCGVFREFDNGGCMFSCTFKTGVSSVNEKKIYYSGTTYEYGKRNGSWVVLRETEIPETYYETIVEEKPPRAGEVTYQTIVVSKTKSNVSSSQTNTYNEIKVLEDGTVVTGKTINYYEKEVAYTYKWWSCKKVQTSSYSAHECGDGEDIDFSTSTKYRNISLLSIVPNISETQSGTYYYMVKYDNGYTNLSSSTFVGSGSTVKKFSLPYVTEETNIRSFDGEFSDIVIYDKVEGFERINDSGVTKIKINYVIGATSGSNISTSGIHYVDTYPYEEICVDKFVIDGLYECDIVYEKIDRMYSAKEVYNDDYMIYRNAYIAEITGMEIGTQWTNSSCINAYLYTDETSDSMMENPSIDVKINYNRGNASAWEKRFKLSECNSLEDLENYGNNYFNL